MIKVKIVAKRNVNTFREFLIINNYIDIHNLKFNIDYQLVQSIYINGDYHLTYSFIEKCHEDIIKLLML